MKSEKRPGLKDWNMRERIVAVMKGETPDRLPLSSRLDFWYNGLNYQGKLPGIYKDLSLDDVYKSIGFGQQEWKFPYRLRLNSAELTLKLDGKIYYRETNPEVYNFPSLWGTIVTDKPGTTEIEFNTPIGKLYSRQVLLPESLKSGATRPITTIHPIRDEDDFGTFEYLLENSEFVASFSEFYERDDEIGDIGFLIPMLNRSPFQTLLLDGLGEVNTIHALFDSQKIVKRTLRVIDKVNLNILENMASFDVPYIEFCENLDVMMTSPRIFSEYVLPVYQSYSDILHKQGKLMGAHLDGNLKGLLNLISESGIDVCESFSPTPLTACTFDEAWLVWKDGPIIWGGIPSFFFQETTGFSIFQEEVERILNIVQESPIILGVTDAFMPDNQIDRLAWLVDRLYNDE